MSMSSRFQPGDHLQVRRRGPYHHHGIYISDDRVIQFGSGITLLDKSRTSVGAVSLEEFERGGAAHRVRHGYESWFGTGYHPPADEPWKVTERAEFMLKLQPVARPRACTGRRPAQRSSRVAAASRQWEHRCAVRLQIPHVGIAPSATMRDRYSRRWANRDTARLHSLR